MHDGHPRVQSTRPLLVACRLAACLCVAAGAAPLALAPPARSAVRGAAATTRVAGAPTRVAGAPTRVAGTPTRVVGTGTPAGCTSAAVVAAVQAGGTITFSCGPKPVTIGMTATAKVMNPTSQVILDGGGLVTLSGEGQRRILYMDTCDPAQGPFPGNNCINNPTPQLTVQNLTFTDGSSIGQRYDATCPTNEIVCASSAGGGGAIFANGGQLKIVGSTFTGNVCDHYGPNIGGGAVRALSEYLNRPVSVTSSHFTGNQCSNGGALSSLGVSWTISGSTFSGNQAIGYGQNPPEPGTQGGGSGGAIYNDGNKMALSITGSQFTTNHANEGGGAIFFVSNNKTGTMAITNSSLVNNPNDGFQSPGLPGIYYQSGPRPVITNSVIK